MIRINLNDEDLFGNDAAEHEPEEIFTKYIVEKPESNIFKDKNRKIAITRAYKGDGKSALLRICKMKISPELSANDVVLSCAGSELAPTLQTEDYATFTREWKKAIIERLANEIGSKIGIAWSDDAISLVEEAERNGFKRKNIVSAITDRLKTTIKVGPASVETKKVEHVVKSLEGVVKRGIDEGSLVWLFVDDIDKNFENTKLQRVRISSFFDAILELSLLIPGLRVRAAVRPNVWTIIKMEYESLSKIEQYMCDIIWTEDDCRRLLAKRIEGYLIRKGEFAKIKPLSGNEEERQKYFIGFIFNSPLDWAGSTRPAHVVINTLSKGRPRWMIELCRYAATRALTQKHEKIMLLDILGDLTKFGDRRIEDTVAEFKSRCPDIEELISAFSREPEELTTDALFKIIDNKILNHLSPRIIGVVGTPTKLQVAAFLFEIGFFYGRRDYGPASYEHFCFSDKPTLFKARTNIDDGLKWEVHPVFRQALEMRDIKGREIHRVSSRPRGRRKY